MAQIKDMTILDLGLRDYEEVWRLQKEFVARRRAGEIPDTVILVEHPPVFTIGRQPDAEASGYLSPGPSPKEGGEFPFPLGKGLGVRSACFSTLPSAEPADSSVGLVVVERGGGITFHGPGQLVGYPIVDLRGRGRNIHRFLRDLEEVLIRTLRDFSLDAQRRPGLTGVWVGPKKIASIGIAVRHWVSYHGFALNVSVDLRYFRMIRPCGLDGTVITSMSELLGREISLAEVKPALVEHWAELFSSEDHAPSVASATLEY
jgi:lipoate-protein ligase B